MTKTANQLKAGETGKVVGLTDVAYSAKLMEMGILPGSQVKLIRKAPLGCPLYLQVDRHFLAIREKEALNIIIAS